MPAGYLLVPDPLERRVSSDRRETASEGRVQARSRTWPVLYTTPGDAVSRDVDTGRRSSRYPARKIDDLSESN